MLIFSTTQLIDPTNIPQAPANSASLGNILTIVFTIIGALAFLMLVISGLRYVVTQGEPAKTAEIRRQIVYISAGLVIAIMADVIVSYVVKKAG